MRPRIFEHKLESLIPTIPLMHILVIFILQTTAPTALYLRCEISIWVQRRSISLDIFRAERPSVKCPDARSTYIPFEKVSAFPYLSRSISKKRSNDALDINSPHSAMLLQTFHQGQLGLGSRYPIYDQLLMGFLKHPNCQRRIVI
jgi:hypothetical protein